MTEPSRSQSYRDSHLDKGPEYHSGFLENPRRALLWRLEQNLLRRIVRRFLGDRPFDHLDFACGTGRILTLLERYSRSSTGVDVSSSMLAVARTQVQRAELVQGDLTTSDLLAGRRFDLITAFRFFPNAEPELRRDAIRALASRLAPDGILVFNNHRNLSSLPFRLVRLLRGRNERGMSHEEAQALVAGAGLRILARYHAGVVPEYETRTLRPRALVTVLETAASHLPLADLAEDVLYVCGHATTEARPGG